MTNEPEVSVDEEAKIPPTPIKHSRVSVVESVYYQAVGEQPTPYLHKFSRTLASDEQPYQRRVKVGELWAPLDTGWITQPGMLILANPAHIFQRQPSAEELLTASANVIEVGVAPQEPEPITTRTQWSEPRPGARVIVFSLIRPGESVRLSPPNKAQFFVRCLASEIKAVITALPS